MMADPARIKVEDASERSTSANEEKTDVKTEPEDVTAAKSTDENKESSSQEQPKQEQKSVSVYQCALQYSGWTHFMQIITTSLTTS